MPDKAAVRAAAARLGLAVAAKPDSQDICFVPAGSYADVVARLRPDAAAPGEIVDRAGRVVGRHDGVARYTVGQAKRLGTASEPAARRRSSWRWMRRVGAWWSARAARARPRCACARSTG
jgi:tRNA-specific 2-thiouridylase